MKSRAAVALVRFGAWSFVLISSLSSPTVFCAPRKADSLWSLQPIRRSELPRTERNFANPIDAFFAVEQKNKNLEAVGPADKLTLLRRVYFDLIGLPPTTSEQQAFAQDASADAYERVVDRLLATDQHGVRYGRHWLDVLRYADVDENMPAAAGIHLWRDWVINALNRDLPYDEFVRAQISGYRSRTRTTMSATGYRSRIDPRPDDLFALGFLARGAVLKRNNGQELALSAVETISTAFLGMTVGCAKCHDHFYDPIKQRDFYSMKALFDPLALKSLTLATADEIVRHGKVLDEYDAKKAAIEGPLDELIEPYRKRLYEERVAMLPPDVQVVLRKPEKARSAAEQKIADDYFPILRIDPPKIREIMPAAAIKEYNKLLKQQSELKKPEDLPVFWSVEENPARALEKSYILTSGDPERPQKDKEVGPGFPFAPANLDFREGRRETFVDWLAAPENPLFARVAVNRIWQWHFGTGLHRNAADFGSLGGEPIHRELLDWLASEFVARRYSMKWLHRLIVTSEAYRRSSIGNSELMAANRGIDPDNNYLWHFPLQRLQAEPIWDAVFAEAGNLDLTLGGKSFRPDAANPSAKVRRAIYLTRGYRSSQEVMPNFLQTFDVDDGRTSCSRRTSTVTAPQALFLMNSPMIDQAAARLAERLWTESGHEISAAVDLGFRMAFARPPSQSEQLRALAYLQNDSQRLKGFAWMLFNLDEFIYVR